MTVFTTKNFTMESGERYCQPVDSVSGGLFYPNLFVTTQIRNRSLSLSAMQAAGPRKVRRDPFAFAVTTHLLAVVHAHNHLARAL
ncbi:hypothetical protein SAMN05421783_1533 [Thiocapsa roseopersicina]|uniref:Uncharacterized protein n=1 Tax=Thiocapsa roseopersicina TaxID=1058 RepID=A0A1H3DM75_THIRO|nr:hypothetical protein SAMN05421783_1533 [Thiocapsa roseopersicina]